MLYCEKSFLTLQYLFKLIIIGTWNNNKHSFKLNVLTYKIFIKFPHSTADIPKADNILITTYSDDTAILGENSNTVTSSNLKIAS